MARSLFDLHSVNYIWLTAFPCIDFPIEDFHKALLGGRA